MEQVVKSKTRHITNALVGERTANIVVWYGMVSSLPGGLWNKCLPSTIVYNLWRTGGAFWPCCKWSNGRWSWQKYHKGPCKWFQKQRFASHGQNMASPNPKESCYNTMLSFKQAVDLQNAEHEHGTHLDVCGCLDHHGHQRQHAQLRPKAPGSHSRPGVARAQELTAANPGWARSVSISQAERAWGGPIFLNTGKRLIHKLIHTHQVTYPWHNCSFYSLSAAGCNPTSGTARRYMISSQSSDRIPPPSSSFFTPGKSHGEEAASKSGGRNTTSTTYIYIL